MSRRKVFAGAAVLVVLATATVALAATSVRKASAPAPPGVTNVVAQCANGAVTLGGFNATTAGSAEALVTRMERSGIPDWRVTVDNFGIAGFVRAIAYCDTAAPPVLSRKLKTGNIPAGTSRQVVAKCPAGPGVVGGGFRGGAPGNTFKLTGFERIAPDGWKVTGYNDTGGNLPLTAIAYCGPPIAVVRASKTVSIAAGAKTRASATASCPAGKTVFIGGFKSTDPINTSVDTLQLATKTGWKVGVFHPVGNAATVTSFAYCR